MKPNEFPLETTLGELERFNMVEIEKLPSTSSCSVWKCTVKHNDHQHGTSYEITSHPQPSFQQAVHTCYERIPLQLRNPNGDSE